MFTLDYKQRSFRSYNRGSEKSMKRALIITTVSGFVPQFEMNNVKILQDLGYEVHYATNYHMPVYTDNNERLEGTGIIQHQIDFVRSPYNIGKNIKALNQLVSLMREIKFHLVHCHTPMGGVLGRVAAHKTNTKPVIYTAHGFHFYKGALVWNWLFFYPVERFLAHWTDCLITINQEDYYRAKTFRVRNMVEYIAGVGIDLKKYKQDTLEKKKKRQEIGIPDDAFLLMSTGELNKNKNHQVIINTLFQLKNKNIHYIICGTGKLKNQLVRISKKMDMEEQIHFLDFRNDINELLNASDCFVFPSKREGLGVAALEAIASGLPVIAFRNRGTLEYVKDGKNGFLCKKNNTKEWSKKIILVKNISSYKRRKIEKYNKQLIRKFGKENNIYNMKKIYRKLEGN